jgi:hypothetical protein
MTALAGDDVVSAVARNIRSNFSDADIKTIYKNLPQQNIQKPYAFIHQINAEHINRIRNRADWVFMLDVRVHPKDGQTDVQSWARAIALKLICALNVITISNQPVKARSIEYRVEDNVLHFIVSYKYGVLCVQDEMPDMQTLEYGERLKVNI